MERSRSLRGTYKWSTTFGDSCVHILAGGFPYHFLNRLISPHPAGILSPPWHMVEVLWMRLVSKKKKGESAADGGRTGQEVLWMTDWHGSGSMRKNILDEQRTQLNILKRLKACHAKLSQNLCYTLKLQSFTSTLFPLLFISNCGCCKSFSKPLCIFKLYVLMMYIPKKTWRGWRGLGAKKKAGVL